MKVTLRCSAWLSYLRKRFVAEMQGADYDSSLLTSGEASVDSPIQLAMALKKSIPNRVLLGAIIFGLNLLCFIGISHGRHAERHTRVNYSYVPAHSAGRIGSRAGWVGQVVTYDSLIDVSSRPRLIHGIASGSATGLQFALVVVSPALSHSMTVVELLTYKNVMALGSAPRAPGLGRAPPVA